MGMVVSSRGELGGRIHTGSGYSYPEYGYS